MSDWMEITMKFNSKCKECQEPMPVGTRGLWLKGEGVKHVNCQGEVTTYDPKEQTKVKRSKKEEEEKSSYELFDETIYPYQTASELKYCQFCGNDIDKTIGDKYMNRDLKSCRSCFNL